MPRLDIYHETVKHALVKDGWTITHDPYKLTIGKKRLFADLGAEMLLSAEKGTRRIVVEIKSFTGVSDVNDLEQAIGQYVLYYWMAILLKFWCLILRTRSLRNGYRIELP